VPVALLTRHQRALDDYLETLLAGRHPPLLDRMIRYHLGWQDVDGSPADFKGKALRPSLCLLACEAAGGNWRRAVPAAAAIELVHNFSLVHDDIQDRDEIRHHRPTVWSIWGEAQAINAGDALLALARLSVLQSVQHDVAADTTLYAARILDERTLEMVEGQVMDLEFEGVLEIDVASYLRMVEKKTGALFDCALGLGGLLAGAKPETVGRLSMCGRLLGLTFQIVDDVLGIWGAEAQTGKSTGADVRRRKKSLPIAYALASSDAAARDTVRSVYAAETVTEEGVSEVLSALDATGARQFCAELAAEKKADAMTELAAAGLTGPAADDLKQAAEFLLEREY
jgi:geranylgeranyl diphosphate synthase type I